MPRRGDLGDLEIWRFGDLGDSAKNEYVFGKKIKTLLYKTVFSSFLGGLEENLEAHL